MKIKLDVTIYLNLVNFELDLGLLHIIHSCLIIYIFIFSWNGKKKKKEERKEEKKKRSCYYNSCNCFKFLNSDEMVPDNCLF